MALAAMPLIGLIALAIDFSAAAAARARLQLAADAASLQAVLSASNAFAADPLTSLEPAKADGLKRFRAQAGLVPGLVGAPTEVDVTRNGGTFQAVVAFRGAYTTTFAGIFGAPSIALSGLATAKITTGPYVDIQILLDSSSSMLIAATPADIQAMIRLSKSRRFADPAPSWWKDGCAFACHWDPANNDFYAASRSGGITLRLDQLKAAIAQIVQAIDDKNAHDLYRLGLYSFSKDVASVYPLSNDVAPAMSAASSIRPPLADPNRAYETNITQSITNMADRYVTQAGDGSAATRPKKFVFILTDGVEDIYAPGRPSSRIETAVNPVACAALKDKGAVVAVLHTLYYNPDGQFNEINAIQANVTRALQSCASSPNLYFAVADQNELNAAIQAMLNVAIAIPARLVQ